MKGYLGETVEDVAATPYANYKNQDWAFYFMERYGQIGGDHHKAWVLDQVARCLHGTPVVVLLARWENGTREYRCSTGEPSAAYLAWVQSMRFPDGEGKDVGEEYDYYVGIAP